MIIVPAVYPDDVEALLRPTLEIADVDDDTLGRRAGSHPQFLG